MCISGCKRGLCASVSVCVVFMCVRVCVCVFLQMQIFRFAWA